MNIQRVRVHWVLAAAAALLAIDPGTGSAASVDRKVQVINNAFSPASVRIVPGDSVTWRWSSGGVQHTVTSDNGAFDSGLRVDGSFERIFPDKGTFRYHCAVHPGMTGAVAVASPNPIRARIKLGGIKVSLRRLTLSGGSLTSPVWGISAPGDTSGRLFVADQTGMLWAVDTDTGAMTQFGNFSSLLVPVAQTADLGERGLLGFAFHPDYESNGLLYTYTSEGIGATKIAPDFPSTAANADHQSVIREWTVPSPGNAGSVVTGNSREILRIDQPQANHNGGALAFGADGMLYIALGDGGNRDDVGDGHDSEVGNAQDLGSGLGKILRINVDDLSVGPYGIPPDNPFVSATGGRLLARNQGCQGDDRKCDEIFAYGFRNPFRMSLDETSGALFAGDVGQDHIEEIDVVRSGRNYGWRYKEGRFCFRPNGDPNHNVFSGNSCVPRSTRLTGPVAQYDHDDGVAVVGGFVYRGAAIPKLRGRYVFGDFAHGDPAVGRLFYLSGKNIVKRRSVKNSGIAELRQVGPTRLSGLVLGFGQDAQNELYVLTNGSGAATGNSGAVWKIEGPVE